MRPVFSSVDIVVFNGRTYRRYPYGKHPAHRKYFRCSDRYLHRDVWEVFRGPIPFGYHVHHLHDNDFNTMDVQRLGCISNSEHGVFHAAAISSVDRACGNIFNTRTIRHHDKYCSNACKSAGRRNEGKDIETRTCTECHNYFQCNKYRRADSLCSRSCKMRRQRRERQLQWKPTSSA